MEKYGYVYILTNPSFREDWVKIGMSSVSVEQRVKQLDGTAVPLPFEIYAVMKTTKYQEAEKLIHSFISMFTNLRIRDNREFFNIKPEVALDIFKQVAKVIDDAVIEETFKVSLFGPTNEEPESKHHKNASSKNPSRTKVEKWVLPANPRFFDLAGCFDKHGCVYWRQHFNFQTSDTIYIYVSTPECAVKYKCLVEGHDLPFSEYNEIDKEFFVNPNDWEVFKQRNRFVKLRLIATTNSNKLTLLHLLENGMKGAPQGCIKLSNYTELSDYIENNF